MSNERTLRQSYWAFLGAFALACGGSSPPPADPSEPPPLDDSPSAAAPPAAASSPKVKEGMDAIQAGDYAKAKALLDQAVKDSPRDAQAAFYLGVADEGLQDGKSAADQYRQALALDPKLVEASTNLAGVLLDQNDAAGALAAAKAGLANAPNSPALLRDKAVALEATGSKEMVPAFKAAVEAAPDDKEVRFLYAEALAESGDAAGATAQLKPILGSTDVAVLASAGRLLGKLKDFDDCVAALDKAIGIKDDPELRVQRGICKHGQNDDKGARTDFEAAIASDAKFAPAHYYLGQDKRTHGDKKGAKAELTKAAALDPSGAVGAAAKKALSELK